VLGEEESKENMNSRKQELYYGVVTKNTDLFSSFKADYILKRLEEFG